MPKFRELDVDYDSELDDQDRRLSGQRKDGTRIHGIDIRYRGKKDTVRDFSFGKSLVRVFSPDIEDEAVQALKAISRYPDIFPYLAVMPDYNITPSGVNGTVMPTKNTLYVNSIGGDIGCGMASMKLPLKLEDLQDNLKEIYKGLYANVPCGSRLQINYDPALESLPFLNQNLEIMNNSNRRAALQGLGTLGSGNHFLDIQKNENNELTLMVHTGSRIIGQHIKGIFLKKANPNNQNGLVSLNAQSKDGQDYLAHMAFGLSYAKENRKLVMQKAYEELSKHSPKLREIPFEQNLSTFIDTAHNYIAKETHFGHELYVHRKGAIHVPEGVLGLVPGSMGAASYIVMGRGNPYSFDSCSHGAGRVLSRGEARNKISLEQLAEATEGIMSRKDEGVLEEAPQAYRDIDKIIRYQKDSVKIVERTTPILVVNS